MSVAELYVPTPKDVRLLDLAFTDVSFQISSWDTQHVEVSLRWTHLGKYESKEEV